MLFGRFPAGRGEAPAASRPPGARRPALDAGSTLHPPTGSAAGGNNYVEFSVSTVGLANLTFVWWGRVDSPAGALWSVQGSTNADFSRIKTLDAGPWMGALGEFAEYVSGLPARPPGARPRGRRRAE
jgi:hypothetical protein